jgi:threonine dehydrogenase-like Zn-dependent dehydrogenase
MSLGVAAFSLAHPRRVLGANERVNIALIGCGGRGRYLARGMVELGAEITYLCDLHQGRLEKAAAFVNPVHDCKPKFDSKTERFVGNEEANKLLKRKYRRKYEVPEKV